MTLKKTIENLWITKALVEGLNKATNYSPFLGVLLFILLAIIFTIPFFIFSIIYLPLSWGYRLLKSGGKRKKKTPKTRRHRPV
ncbi:MAG: hypothetical protein Q3983_01055 [Capnocytophaga sp.]|nr:hypothetical protein [Capnocytophaga sp.]